MSGRTAGFLSSMGDSTRHGGDAFFMGVFDDNHLVVYLDANRSKPVLRLDLKCVHSFVMDNTDDSPCVRMQFVDSRNHMHLFVFECRGNDGLQEARKWAAVFTNATAR
ncbi:hypothetical protein DYB32_001345 [Aphanomyces invadans]|uniref:PH domain-containing protein n=1 Tax=Aphanomyces invadans TaxID=157072 RepID=A0A3R7AF88_9STRA|nr:hypothetical protein DYB32_001345 [Aphanomyces invadans]